MKSFIALATIGGCLLFFSAGCNSTADETDKSKSPDEAADTSGQHGLHGGWWCGRHGIPEDECAMCNKKLAAEHREDGDWCEEHSRPDSLCFKCHPEKAEQFAQLYEEKVGKKPPARKD